MDQCRYSVVFEKFTERHFVKKFKNKYGSQWDRTQEDIVFVCEHIQNMLQTKRADLISIASGYRLVKLDFAIFGQKISPKSSGNRCILVVDDNMKTVRVLLVYSKNDISTKSETQEWKKLIKAQYQDIAKIFGL